MVDFSKLKQKNQSKSAKWGPPPSLEEAKDNLATPETFETVAENTQTSEYVDGRTLRKTGRTHQLSTRVTDEFYKRVRMIAARDNLKIVELLEKAIDTYEA